MCPMFYTCDWMDEKINKTKPNQIHILWPWELMSMNRFPVTDINIAPVEFF